MKKKKIIKLVNKKGQKIVKALKYENISGIVSKYPSISKANTPHKHTTCANFF